MDVPTDEQELPEPVKLRAICEVSDEWEKGEAETYPTSTDHVSGPIQTASNGETVGKNQVNSLYISCTFGHFPCEIRGCFFRSFWSHGATWP